MKKFIFLFVLLWTALQGRDGYGYALFGLGAQESTYFEEFESKDGETLSLIGSVLSPYYYTGTGVKFNESIDFSISGSATLYVNSTSQSSLKFSDKNILHSMDLQNSDLMLYAHYKYTKRQHFLFGVGYSNETIKRYLFEDSTIGKNTIVETNTFSGDLEAGYQYQSDDNLRNSKWNYAFTLMFGMPLFNSVTQIYSENLNDEKTEFKSAYGFAVKPTIYVAHRLFKGMDLAFDFSYYYRLRFNKTQFIYNAVEYDSKKSTLVRLRAGLFAIWNFDQGDNK